MDSCNKPCLVSIRTIHNNIKYHMSLYLFVIWRNLTVPHFFQWNTFQFLKRFLVMLHLFPYIIPPVRYLCTPINVIFLLYTLGKVLFQTYDSSSNTYYLPLLRCDPAYLIHPHPTILMQAPLTSDLLQHIQPIPLDFTASGLSAWYKFISHPWTPLVSPNH